MEPDPYVLVIVAGTTPQVLTETVWSLARQHRPPRHPRAVHVITTSVGQAMLEARLMGRPAFHPVTGEVLGAHDRWTPFCRAILGGGPPPLHYHVPVDAGRQPLSDIRTADDDHAFAACCYAAVAELAAQSLPLVGSLAGGRKTMSAHLMAAFSVYARPADTLVHVLVSPATFERDPAFFYPTPDLAGFVRIDRVHPAFPRLRHDLAGRDGRLPAVPEVLHRLQSPGTRAPSGIRVCLNPRAAGGCRLIVLDPGGAIRATESLSPAEAATFLVLAEAFRARAGKVPNTGMVAQPDVEMRRTAVRAATGNPSPFSAWTHLDDLSKHVSKLNRRLQARPALRCLVVHSTPTRDATYYTWPDGLPPVTVSLPASFPPEEWPFEHLSRAETPEDACVD